jgi:hypothetical protein
MWGQALFARTDARRTLAWKGREALGRREQLSLPLWLHVILLKSYPLVGFEGKDTEVV